MVSWANYVNQIIAKNPGLAAGRIEVSDGDDCWGWARRMKGGVPALIWCRGDRGRGRERQRAPTGSNQSTEPASKIKNSPFITLKSSLWQPW